MEANDVELSPDREVVSQLPKHQDGQCPPEEQQHMEHSLDLNDVQWHTPVPISALVCSGTGQNFTVNDELLWQGHTIQVDSVVSLESMQSLPGLNNQSEQELREESVCIRSTDPVRPQNLEKLRINSKRNVYSDGQNLKCMKKKRNVQGKGGKMKGTSPQVINTDLAPNSSKPFHQTTCAKSPQKSSKIPADSLNSTVLEENSMQVRERFLLGCECQDANCFDGLNPDNVFRHRLNIAELTKEEHDMYLMGLTMACLTDREQTNRKKERQRLRANYVYQGRPVCLQAFLYLENCTCYQVKRIRKHVITHGVVPRIHGNHGKRPHNTFSLDIYRHATDFLKMFIREKGQVKDCHNKTVPILLGVDITRKYVHQEYSKYCHGNAPGSKIMSYSTFRHFMKEQFPHIRFRHQDGLSVPRDTSCKHQQQSGRHKASIHNLGYQFSSAHQKGLSYIQSSKVVQYANSSEEHQRITVSGGTAGTAEGQEMEIEEQSIPEVQCSTESEVQINSNGNVVVIDTLPVIPTHNFISTQSHVPSGTRGAKVLTVNSSSLRFLSAENESRLEGVRNVSPGAIVPMNSIAVLGSGGVPFIIDSCNGVSVVPCQKQLEEQDQYVEQNRVQKQEERSHVAPSGIREDLLDHLQETPTSLPENTSALSALDNNVSSFPFAVTL